MLNTALGIIAIVAVSAIPLLLGLQRTHGNSAGSGTATRRSRTNTILLICIGVAMLAIAVYAVIDRTM